MLMYVGIKKKLNKDMKKFKLRNYKSNCFPGGLRQEAKSAHA